MAHWASGDWSFLKYSLLFALCFPLGALQHPQLALQWLFLRPWIRAAPVWDLLNLKNSRTPQEHLITFALKALQPVLWQHIQDNQGCTDMTSEFSPDYHKPDTNYPKQNIAIEPWFISPPHNSTCLSVAESCHLFQAGRFTKVQTKVIVVYVADSYRYKTKLVWFYIHYNPSLKMRNMRFLEFFLPVF